MDPGTVDHGELNKPRNGIHIVALPLLASLIMLAWDVAMDPVWSTIERAWLWRDGGAYFGVPISNFAGWFLTAFLFYLAFAIYSKADPDDSGRWPISFWQMPILIYGMCAAGNLLLFKKPMAPSIVVDASGKSWSTEEILLAGAIVSVIGMGLFALAAWTRLGQRIRLAGTQSV